MSEVIFTTIHGSRLYGFDHERSDEDVFIVTDSTRGKARQTIVGNEDRFTVGLSRFLDLATSGSHQSVEALFSPFKEWGDGPKAAQYRPMIESIRVGGVAEKFERTIRRFSYGDFKQRRHACRLYFALDDLRIHGRMRPNLHRWQIDWCTRTAEELNGYDLTERLGVTHSPTKEDE